MSPNIYRPNTYSNPYFKKRKAPKTSRFYYSLMTLGIVIIAWLYFLFSSSFFVITDWEINGLTKYNEESIESELKNFFSKKKYWLFNYSNIIIFNKDNFKEYLSSEYIFNKLEVQKKYTHKLILNFEEKNEKLAIYNNDKFYILSDDGTIVEEGDGVKDVWVTTIDSNTVTTTSNSVFIDQGKILADATTKSLPNYPIFYDATDREGVLRVGDIYPEKKIISILNQFIDTLHERTEIKAKTVTIYKNKINQKITVYTNNDWQIYLNDTDDGLRQFYKLFLAYNNEIKDINKPLEYIDLRFGDRVYIK